MLCRETFQEYAQHMKKLALKIMELIALSLGLPPKRFDDFFKDETSWIRLNHYPPCPNPDIVLGCGRHKDSGALTVLAQDEVSGLEVRRKSDGEWVLVKPLPNAYIINVGDVIQVLYFLEIFQKKVETIFYQNEKGFFIKMNYRIFFSFISGLVTRSTL